MNAHPSVRVAIGSVAAVLALAAVSLLRSSWETYDIRGDNGVHVFLPNPAPWYSFLAVAAAAVASGAVISTWIGRNPGYPNRPLSYVAAMPSAVLACVPSAQIGGSHFSPWLPVVWIAFILAGCWLGMRGSSVPNNKLQRTRGGSFGEQ